MWCLCNVGRCIDYDFLPSIRPQLLSLFGRTQTFSSAYLSSFTNDFPLHASFATLPFIFFCLIHPIQSNQSTATQGRRRAFCGVSSYGK
ncbi:hypothetical protein AAC387_Pa07g1410 [Persea americana]